MTSRITPLEPPFDPPTVELLGKMMPPGVDVPPLAVFRALARLPKVGKRLAGVGGVLLQSATLPLPLRELAILRTTARCGAEYEWGVHVSWLAEVAGLSPEQVATTAGDVAGASWSDEQRAVLRAVDALYESSTLSDDVFTELANHLDEDAILELTVVVGFYHLISFVVRVAALPGEPWAATFPV